MKFQLTRIRLNNGGYDCNGSYWGQGAPLYQFQSETDSDICGSLRAHTRAQAKAETRTKQSNARFYR